MVNGTNGPENQDRWLQQVHQHRDDYAWVMRQDQLVERYHGQVILVHQREVLGSGRDHLEALESARTALQEAGRAMPPREEWLFVIVPEMEDLEHAAQAVARQLHRGEDQPGRTGPG